MGYTIVYNCRQIFARLRPGLQLVPSYTKGRIMIGKNKAFRTIKFACAYFFICPGLTYGLFTARLPAYKACTGANDSEIGLILLSFGLASLVGLFSGNFVIARFGSPKVLRYSSMCTLLGIISYGFAQTPLQLAVIAAATGLGTGFCDVSMNTLGLEVEHQYKVSCMSFLHAAYSFGGVIGSVGGAIFAAWSISPLWNAIIILGIYACFRPIAIPRLQRGYPHKSGKSDRSKLLKIPFYVFICGFFAMLAYAVEGSSAEWGSIFLHGDKGASPQLAALVYAAFSLSTVISRLSGDSLRATIGDFILLLGGSIIAFIGMALVIYLDDPVLCLGGYTLVGFGVAPIVPILFSRAAICGHVTAAQASSVVSFLAYAGMLFFPPMLGFVGDHYGLANSLLIVLASCLVLAGGSFFVVKKQN